MIKIRDRQKGMTLIELVISLSIAAMIACTASGLIIYELKGTTSAKIHVSAAHEIGNAARFLCKDVMMAENTDLIDGDQPVNELNLTWINRYEFSNVPYSCTYSLNGTTLQRYFNGTLTDIARNITCIEYSIDGEILQVSISYTSQSWYPKTVVKTYGIYLRTGETSELW
ncbi:type II secretion system protein J [Chloroflexota bacterium]